MTAIEMLRIISPTRLTAALAMTETSFLIVPMHETATKSRKHFPTHGSARHQYLYDSSNPEFIHKQDEGGRLLIDMDKTAPAAKGPNPKDPASWGKVARNDPCGSGKRYKNCHGAFA